MIEKCNSKYVGGHSIAVVVLIFISKLSIIKTPVDNVEKVLDETTINKCKIRAITEQIVVVVVNIIVAIIIIITSNIIRHIIGVVIFTR